VSLSDGLVVLKLGGLAEVVLEQLDERFGADFAGRVPAERLDTIEFVPADPAQLADLQAGDADPGRVGSVARSGR